MRVSRTSEAMPFAPTEVTVPSVSEPSPNVESSAASLSPEHRPGSLAAPFLQLLRGLGRELDRGENMTEMAIRSGGHGAMSPARLIALQAGIYRYSEAVDLVTKLVDRGTQAVRTTLQNQ
jgi:hypothetical protein